MKTERLVKVKIYILMCHKMSLIHLIHSYVITVKASSNRIARLKTVPEKSD